MLHGLPHTLGVQIPYDIMGIYTTGFGNIALDCGHPGVTLEVVAKHSFPPIAKADTGTLFQVISEYHW
jgi:hypothetical protein